MSHRVAGVRSDRRKRRRHAQLSAADRRAGLAQDNCTDEETTDFSYLLSHGVCGLMLLIDVISYSALILNYFYMCHVEPQQNFGHYPTALVLAIVNLYGLAAVIATVAHAPDSPYCYVALEASRVMCFMNMSSHVGFRLLSSEAPYGMCCEYVMSSAFVTFGIVSVMISDLRRVL